MFWLIYVTVIIQNVLLWLECQHGHVCANSQWHHQQRAVSLQLTRQ